MAGWNRASLDLNTHPLHPFPKVTQADLLLPSARDRLMLFGACLVCSAGLSVLWIYFPLFLVGILLKTHPGAWLWESMLAATVAGGLVLFAIAAVRERRYAAEIL
jgi:hypothetical protein